MRCHSVFAVVFLCVHPTLIHSQKAGINKGKHDDQIYYEDNMPAQTKGNIEATSERVVYYNEQNFRDRPQNDASQNLGVSNYVPNQNLQTFNDRNVNFNDISKTHPLIVKAVTPRPQPLAYFQNQNRDNFNNKNVNLSAPETVQQSTLPTNVGLSTAVGKFGLNLLKTVQSLQSGNVVVSPVSIAVSLGLLQQGAFGDTQRQISEALQMTSQDSAKAFKNLNEELKKHKSRSILRVATNLFIASGFTVNPDFKRAAIGSFNSDVTPMNFNQPEVAVNYINSWVGSKTENRINKLLSTDAVGQNTQLILVNAVFFKGLWQTMFKPDATLNSEFRLRDGQKKEAPFMRMRTHVKAGFDSSTGCKIVSLPFEAGQYSLMLILPNERITADAVVSMLTAGHLLAYTSFPLMEVQLWIPRFTAKSDVDLNPVLQKMGVTNIFGQNSELHGIGSFRNFSAQVSAAKHSAVLSIDEQGGVAAAATAFAVVALSYDEPAMLFKADKPFVAILWDNELAMPLFMAKIEDPTL